VTARPRRRPAIRLRPLPGGRTAIAVVMALIAALASVAHLPLRNAGYVQDDHLAVESNPIVARGDLAEIFGTDYWAGATGSDRSLYRPVTILSFALERRLSHGAADPDVSHAINLLLHVLAAAALLLLGSRIGLGGFAASAAALLFAVHPVHVEAIANIVGRAEILAALFTFLSLLALAAAIRARSVGRRLAGSCSAAGCLFLALGSKESAVVAPLLMLLLDLLHRPKGEQPWWQRAFDRLAALGPSLAVVVLFLAMRTVALEALFVPPAPHPMDNPLVALEGSGRLATALALAWRAAWLLVFPVKLSADYSGGVIPLQTQLLAPGPLAGLAVLAGAAWLVARPWLGGGRAATAARAPAALSAALFLFPYLVVGNLLVLVGTIFAERLLYLPSAGFCLLLALALRKVSEGFPAFGQRLEPERGLRRAGAVLVILVAAFALRSWERSHQWRDDETLFRSAAEVYPSSPRGHFIAAKAREEAGDSAAAVRGFERTLEVWPGHVPARFELGVVLARQGRLAAAERLFRETFALQRDDSNPTLAWFNLGIALHRQGRLEEAERVLRKAVLCRPRPPWRRCDPADPATARPWAELAHVRFDRGDLDGAARAYRRAFAAGWTVPPGLLPTWRQRAAALGLSPR